MTVHAGMALRLVQANTAYAPIGGSIYSVKVDFSTPVPKVRAAP